MSKKVSPEKKKVGPVKEVEIKQEEQKVEREREQAHQKVKILETSGILDAYEYLLRQVCKNGLPDTNIFEFSAQQILKYEKKMKLNNQKREELFGGGKQEGQKQRGSVDKRMKQDRSRDKGLNK